MTYMPSGMYRDQPFLPETMSFYCLFEKNYVQELSEFAHCLWLGSPVHFVCTTVTIKNSNPEPNS